MLWRRITVAALAVYCLWSILLVAQRPGLQYDEALLVAGAVTLRHPATLDRLPRSPDTWTCHRGVCFPLMAEGRYIGPIKEYLAVPLFAIFGPSAKMVRAVSILLGLIGLWGMARFLTEQGSPPLGAALAFVLAVSPSYLKMTVFDNGAVAAPMAALGLCAAALSAYILKRTPITAFLVGTAAGFGIWTRANFLWTLAAAVIAIALIARLRALPPLRHIAAMVLGGLLGGFPFLWYQVISHGGTFQAVTLLQSTRPLSEMFYERSIMFADVLLAESEHTIMWGALHPPLWQLWLFGLITGAACLAAFCFRRSQLSPLAQTTTLTLLILTAFLFSSKLQIAEHHLIAILPIAATVVVITASILQQRFSKGWLVTAGLMAIYLPCALYWDVQAVRGLHATGGVGVWSNSINHLTETIQTESAGRATKILDWGFYEPLFVLSDGAIVAEELEDASAPDRSTEGHSWTEEINAGGPFLLSGADNQAFPGPMASFLAALAKAHPIIDRHEALSDGAGMSYAELLDIRPNTAGQGPAVNSTMIEIPFADPASERLLSGFYPPETAGWRWSYRHFAVTFEGFEPGTTTPWVRIGVYIPPGNIEKLGAITLSAKMGAHALEPQTFREPGLYTYKRRLDPSWFTNGTATVAFDLDKWLAPSSADSRELGTVVNSAALEFR